MKNTTILLLPKSFQFVLVCMMTLLFVTGAGVAQATYGIGDQVEVQWPGDNQWYKAKVTQIQGGKYLIVYDQDGLNAFYTPDRMRLIKAASAPQPTSPPMAPQTQPADPQVAAAAVGQALVSTGASSVDADGTVVANRPILQCPIKQTQATNGQAPDRELIARLIRCAKGEKPAAKGGEGAVTIDISSLSIGKPRRWNPLEDSGSGANVDYTIVYPVEVTYSEETLYFTRTVVNENWMRVINFYVDGFNEWRICSEVPVKPPVIKNIPRAK